VGLKIGAEAETASTPITQLFPAGNVPGIFENHGEQKLSSPKSLGALPPVIATLEITTDVDPVLVTVTNWGKPVCPKYNWPKFRLVGVTFNVAAVIV